MADINKNEIKLMSSQRLDDTAQGGGQMIGTEIVDGLVNNLFPDISRLDHTYGRVSMRKAFLSVRTLNRAVYYGAHMVITEQAADPLVGVCFFTTQDWFDTRDNAKNRIEAYLVKGPKYNVALYGDIYAGTKVAKLQAYEKTLPPEVGDVLVLSTSKDLNGQSITYHEEFARVIDVNSELLDFVLAQGTVKKQIITLTFGTGLTHDFPGESISFYSDYNKVTSPIYTTVVADSSKYYSVTSLAEEAMQDAFHFKVKDVTVPIVPSAQSQSAILDVYAGVTTQVPFQTDPSSNPDFSLSVSFNPTVNETFYFGSPVKMGSINFDNRLVTDNSKGDMIHTTYGIVGTVAYDTGIIHWTNPWTSSAINCNLKYTTAAAVSRVSQTGSIPIDINNRGFVYVFDCVPLPSPATLQVWYLVNSKWYLIRDIGNGEIKGTDAALGTGTVNYLTGSVSLTLGAQPDVGSVILLFWAENVIYTDISGEAAPFMYEFDLQDTNVYPGSLVITYTYDGEHTLSDSGGDILLDGGSIVGSIRYSDGYVIINNLPHTPQASIAFNIQYDIADPAESDKTVTETFNAPPRDYNNGFNLELNNTEAIVPGSLQVQWQTSASLPEYEQDPGNVSLTYGMQIEVEKYNDDMNGAFQGEDATHGGIADAWAAIVDYSIATGSVKFYPDFQREYSYLNYDWVYSAIGNTNNWHRVYKETVTKDDGLFEYDDSEPITVTYCIPGAVVHHNYTQTLDKKYKFNQENITYMVQSTGVFEHGSISIFDRLGKLYTGLNNLTGEVWEIGTIAYDTKTLTITEDYAGLDSASENISLFCKSGYTKPCKDSLSSICFKTPGAPITPGSFTLAAVASDGSAINCTADFSGTISGCGAEGNIQYSTGIVTLVFGIYVPDDAEAQAADWYNAGNVDGANVFKPYFVDAQSVSFNCVIESYLPLDADLLGLNPVRLPVDGKVPAFREGDIILLHHTIQDQMPNPLSAGDVFTTSRTNASMIELRDANGVFVSETDNYTVDLAAGTVTMNDPLDLSAYTQPLVALNRIEDMVLASDVQITGYISCTAALTHDYPADETLVSSVLPIGDLQSRIYNEFVQKSWFDHWLDTAEGDGIVANYDLVNYPILVNNKSAVEERFACIFTSSTTFEVFGEHLGVLLTDVPITNDAAPINPATGEPYFTIQSAGWGAGWSSGNVFRFNSSGANYPVWFVRTTLQGPPVEDSDHYTTQIRGDSS